MATRGKNQTANPVGGWSLHEDNGCSLTLRDGSIHIVSRKCLECPLPQCIEDDIKLANKLRTQLITEKQQREMGITLETDTTNKAVVEELARVAGCTTRSIFRRLRRMRTLQEALGEAA